MKFKFGHKQLKSGTKWGNGGIIFSGLHSQPSVSDKPLRAFKYWSTNNQNK